MPLNCPNVSSSCPLCPPAVFLCSPAIAFCPFVSQAVVLCPMLSLCVPQPSFPGNSSQLNFPPDKGFDNIHQSLPDYIAKFPNFVAPMKAFVQIIKGSNIKYICMYTVLSMYIQYNMGSVLIPMLMNVPLKAVFRYFYSTVQRRIFCRSAFYW